MQFSIKSLAFVTAVIAFLTAGTAKPSADMTFYAVAVVWLWLTAAAIQGIFARGRVRAYWLGVLITGFSVLLLFGEIRVIGIEFTLNSDYQSMRVLGRLYRWVHGSNDVNLMYFVRTGRVLGVFCMSLGGGWLALRAYDQRGGTSIAREANE